MAACKDKRRVDNHSNLKSVNAPFKIDAPGTGSPITEAGNSAAGMSATESPKIVMADPLVQDITSGSAAFRSWWSAGILVSNTAATGSVWSTRGLATGQMIGMIATIAMSSTRITAITCLTADTLASG